MTWHASSPDLAGNKRLIRMQKQKSEVEMPAMKSAAYLAEELPRFGTRNNVKKFRLAVLLMALHYYGVASRIVGSFILGTSILDDQSPCFPAVVSSFKSNQHYEIIPTCNAKLA